MALSAALFAPSSRPVRSSGCGRLLAARPNAGAPTSHRRHTAVAASAAEPAPTASTSGKPAPATIPWGPQETVRQAAAAVERALEAGVRRQRVELLLPLIGATDLDDWPGGIRQQFKAAQPMVEELLRQLKQLPALEGPLAARILDDGDAVAAWEGAGLAAVLFPTAETLGEVRRIAEARRDGLVLIINPQYTTEGQLVSDFGIFPWQRKAAEDLIGSFAETFTLRQLRINGDDARLLKAYPAPWQINLTRPESPAQSECVAQLAERPSYKELESLLRAVPWSMGAKPLAERLKYEAQFLRSSTLEGPPRRQ